MKEPCAGPDIIDLSILPPLVDFFFVGDEADLASKYKLDDSEIAL